MTRTRQPPRKRHRKPTFKPWWLVVIVGCGLASYVVVTRSDEITEVYIQGSGIAFRGGSATNSLSPEAQRERSRDVEEQVEAQVREASPAVDPSPVDLTGTWVTPDGMVTWVVSLENGYFVFREQNATAPGVISAAGYGVFDGRTWSLQFQTIFGAAGSASLSLSDDGALEGEAVVAGGRFSLALQR